MAIEVFVLPFMGVNCSINYIWRIDTMKGFFSIVQQFFGKLDGGTKLRAFTP